MQKTHSLRLTAMLQRVLLADGDFIPYDKLCICTGATPKVLDRLSQHMPVLLSSESMYLFSWIGKLQVTCCVKCGVLHHAKAA